MDNYSAIWKEYFGFDTDYDDVILLKGLREKVFIALHNFTLVRIQNLLNSGVLRSDFVLNDKEALEIDAGLGAGRLVDPWFEARR